MDDYEEAVLFTLTLLESRLERLEYVLSGSNKQAEQKPKTLPERVKRIERSLQELSAKTALLNEVRDLSTAGELGSLSFAKYY
jgi:lipoate-protein ligase A